MEDPTPFDLNAAVHSWLDRLSRSSPHFRQEDLLELETHVADSIAAFRAKGLSDEEAFLMATRRLGPPSGLEAEFAKVNRKEVWLNRLLWMLIGVQAWGVLVGVSRTVTNALLFGGLWGPGFQLEPGRAGLDWSRALLPVTLLTVAYLLVPAGILAGSWWIIRHKESDSGRLLAWALRRPVVVGVVAALALLLLQGLGPIESYLFTHYYLEHHSVTDLGAVRLCQAVSGSLVQLAQTVGFVTLTIALFHRRLRPTALSGGRSRGAILQAKQR